VIFSALTKYAWNSLLIMDALRLRGNCSPRQLQKLNACRMHLRVSRLSEIASADGRTLHRDSLVGNESAIHLSATKLPRQARPLPADWNLWRNKLRLVFSTADSFKLLTSLGAWRPSLVVSEWPALMSAQTVPRQAYHRLPDGKYEVFVEEVSGRNNPTLLLGVSY
jgi:hypothetical protein